jgi:two-component system response regulator (stage 0 sporulation protein F)
MMPKILIVDDERHIRELYTIALEDDGYVVFSASSCHGLLEKIDEIQPDAVILDIRLVTCDGLEMLTLLRDRHHDLPIVLCSAYDSYRDDIRAAAADYYVVKSFELDDLRMKLERALQAGASLRFGQYGPAVCESARE